MAARLILVPQYPTRLRYQEWWWDEFPKRLSKYFDEIVVLGKTYGDSAREAPSSKFAPMKSALMFERNQIMEYLDLELRKDDVLLLNDLSYPGLFANILFHMKPERCFAICHATSKNRYDYFADVRYSKYPVEKGIAKLFDAIIVASKYHSDKLGWNNLYVLPFPEVSSAFSSPQLRNGTKKYRIISVAREGVQKVTKKIEEVILQDVGISVYHPDCKTWLEYYEVISSSQMVLITSKEETFGYQVVDAYRNNCIPVAPNKFSYPELLPREYLYDNQGELFMCMHKVFNDRLPVLQSLMTTEQSGYFYDNLRNLMVNE